MAKIKKWDDDLPDTEKWTPRQGLNNLKRGLQLQCDSLESEIIAATEGEIAFNINNFDSGSGVEDIVREALRTVLPSRYHVDAGVANDSTGSTAGDFEVLITNQIWSPLVKQPATLGSRRKHFAAASLYAAVEVKQTLDFDTLDAAAEKLVKASRLERAVAPYGQVTENQHFEHLDRARCTVNPLATFIFSPRMDKDVTFEGIRRRFHAISKKLDRKHVIHGVVVLGEGMAFHATGNGDNVCSADFMTDTQSDLLAAWLSTSPFYAFVKLLLGHLNRSVLPCRQIIRAFGDELSYKYELL